MHCQVYRSGKKSLFYFLCEKSFSFNLIEAQMLDGVAFRFNDFDGGIHSDIAQLLLNEMCLPQSQVAASRANDNVIFQSENFLRK